MGWGLQPQKRASVQDLLGSAWLQMHEATDGPACIRTCGAWFGTGSVDNDDRSYDDDEYEIEEEIE